MLQPCLTSFQLLMLRYLDSDVHRQRQAAQSGAFPDVTWHCSTSRLLKDCCLAVMLHERLTCWLQATSSQNSAVQEPVLLLHSTIVQVKKQESGVGITT